MLRLIVVVCWLLVSVPVRADEPPRRLAAQAVSAVDVGANRLLVGYKGVW